MNGWKGTLANASKIQASALNYEILCVHSEAEGSFYVNSPNTNQQNEMAAVVV